MRIAGRRADGALYLSLGGGIAVVLKGYYMTPPLDAVVVDDMGPWESANNEFAERTRVERILNTASLAPMSYFALTFEKGNPFAKKDDGDKTDKADAPFGGKKAAPFGEKTEDEAVALDKFHSLDETREEKDKKPVSEVAQAAQSGEAAAPPAVEVLNLTPVDPAEERRKKREALKGKVKAAARSKGRTADVLADEDISDEDLFAMAKELGVTLDETPDAVTLIDNTDRFKQLLASTTTAKHMQLQKDEHPFQWCMDNVIPAMEREGKAPDDPEAFCAYWKAENA